MFPTENIEHMTKNIGFLDEEVIWLYTFFTDVRTSPVTFTLKELEASMAEEDYTFSREGKTCRYQFKESGRFYTCYMVDDTSDSSAQSRDCLKRMPDQEGFLHLLQDLQRVLCSARRQGASVRQDFFQ